MFFEVSVDKQASFGKKADDPLEQRQAAAQRPGLGHLLKLDH